MPFVNSRKSAGTLAVWTTLAMLTGPTTPLVAQAVLRGPYLQQGTANSVVVRWRTDSATDSRVRYGASPGALTAFADDPTPTTEHEVILEGLAASTRYYYSIGTSSQVLAGGDTDHYFQTPPPAGTAAATRLWILGDSGTADSNARAVRDAYLSFTNTAHTNLWLMLGDNAYNDGTDSQYQNAVFNMYPSVLRQSVLWPTLGNHDGFTADSATQSGPYYDIFTLPTSAEAGGVASGTEAYYSFDHANIHFISLESYETDRSSTGAMLTWLEQDLLSTTQDWVIAFWHHPPYTKGSHDSDNEIEHIEMRENALPILEDAGVDLVFGGHSHSYERSYLIDGHYGFSSSFDPVTMVVDGGDGDPQGDGAYTKASLGPQPHAGAVYVVAGSSGKISGGSLDHPVMHLSLNVLGSVVLDVDGGRLDARFLDNNAAVRDLFTMVKGTGAGTQPAPPTGLTALAGDGLVSLDWDDSPEFDVASYSVYRSEIAGGPYSLLDLGILTSDHVDATVTNDTTYYYVVTATDADGLESALSAEVLATPEADTTPPAVPTGLVALAGNGVVDLDWDDNTEPDLDTYSVYRSETSGGPYSLQVAGLVSSDYSDTTVTNDTTYFYVVSAVDGSGNESAPSAEASATPTGLVDDVASADGSGQGTVSGTYLDTTLADAVYQSIVERESGGKPVDRHSYLEHEWTVNVTGGTIVTFFLKAYKSASSDGDDFDFLYSANGSAFAYLLTVTRTIDDGTYQTAELPPTISGDATIRVVDTDQTPGNQSLDEILVDHLFVRSQTTSDSTPPSAPTGLGAVAVHAGRVDLDWNDNSEADLVGYNVYRSTVSGGPYDLVAGTVASSAHSDTTVSPATTYYYVVTAEDSSGNESTASLETSATTPQGCAPSATHVEDLLASLAPVGNGSKSRGHVEVTVLDDCGVPVAGASVSGTFSGDVSGSASGMTDGNGVAILTSSPAKTATVSYTFCVDDISHASLTHDAQANVVTCTSFP